MKKKPIIFIFLLIVISLSACINVENSQKQNETKPSSNQSEQNSTGAQISKVYTNLKKESGWWIIPKGISSMTINTEVKNIDTVLFWLVPGGTETWGERSLLGYDKDGNDGWSFKWEFGNQTFHDYIYIQALGTDGTTQANETISITTDVP